MWRIEQLKHLGRRLSITIERVFEADARAGTFCHKTYVEFRNEVWIEAPVRRDLPSEHETGGRFDRQHLAPLAFPPILSPFNPTHTSMCLDAEIGRALSGERCCTAMCITEEG